MTVASLAAMAALANEGVPCSEDVQDSVRSRASFRIHVHQFGNSSDGRGRWLSRPINSQISETMSARLCLMFLLVVEDAKLPFVFSLLLAWQFK